MSYPIGRNISKLFTEEKSPFTEERNVIILILNKWVYINLAQVFLFFFTVWSKSLKILACVKIGIKGC